MINWMSRRRRCRNSSRGFEMFSIMTTQFIAIKVTFTIIRTAATVEERGGLLCTLPCHHCLLHLAALILSW